MSFIYAFESWRNMEGESITAQSLYQRKPDPRKNVVVRRPYNTRNEVMNDGYN